MTTKGHSFHLFNGIIADYCWKKPRMPNEHMEIKSSLLTGVGIRDYMADTHAFAVPALDKRKGRNWDPAL